MPLSEIFRDFQMHPGPNPILVIVSTQSEKLLCRKPLFNINYREIIQEEGL